MEDGAIIGGARAAFWGPPDMMSALKEEGAYGKADILRDVAQILLYTSVPNADKGGGG